MHESTLERGLGHKSIPGSPLLLPRWKIGSRFGPRGVFGSRTAIAIAFMFLLGGTFHVFRLKSASGDLPRGHGSFQFHGTEALSGVFPSHMSPDSGFYDNSEICSVCHCSESSNPFYEPSGSAASRLPKRPLNGDIYTAPDNVDLNEFVRLTLLDMYCGGQHLTTTQSLKLLNRATTAFDEVASWALSDLQLGKPTIYIVTASSPNSKAGPLRPQYFERHGRAIKSWLIQQVVAGVQSLGFQVLWIVAEDEVNIDRPLALSLRQTAVPYIYFSYGLTKSWGNAQKNAALQMVNALSRHGNSRPDGQGVLGHGPVYSLDDDNKMLSTLLTVLTRVVRCGVFPVGNLVGPGGWESPTVDGSGQVTGSDGPWVRPFPFDYGAYSFNSSLLGPVVTGPRFWKWEAFGGETEFLQQIVGHVRDLEPLCGPTMADQENCHYVWHNEPLADKAEMADETAP